MRIVVCVKEVLDPDAVNNYAIAGRLVIGDDGKSLTQTTIPRLMNGFDEQALEAALQLRDAGVDCHITVVSAGPDPAALLKHAAALGADEIVSIPLEEGTPDYHVMAALLAAYVSSSGGADLVLCGRQASDDDQGVVPALMGEILGMPTIPVARAVASVEVSGAPGVRVTRVTPDGDEVVEAALPAVVTVSNELGEPRYPTAKNKIAARRKKPTVVTPAELALAPEAMQPRATLARQFVPEVHGHCEFIEGSTPAELANRLVERLRAEKVL